MNTENTKLLPAWFVERMMHDSWSFGLLTVSGTTICIESITSVHQAADGSIWLDVVLMQTTNAKNTFVAPTSRTSASINSAHIVAAFELADT